MRVLVLGGTVFLSRAVAMRALERGHDVTCVARGVSGSPPEGTRFVRLDRADPDALERLRDERFDAVVDVATQAVTQVKSALRVLGAHVPHWTYVSSRSVYADESTPGQRATTSPRLAGAPIDADESDPSNYGPLKVAAEDAVLWAMEERAFIVRPGLVVGYGDRSDRYGYWPARMSRGGAIVCPGDPKALVQLIDVEDLAAWIVIAAEEWIVGTFDATCAPTPIGEVLARTASVCSDSTDLVWLDDQFLLAHEVEPWAGPRSLPLWAPGSEYAGFGSHDVTPALEAGLTIRATEATAHATLEWERQLGLDRPRVAGLSREDEDALLAAAQLALR
jgi:2'-hydroxyisoflavone reductase